MNAVITGASRGIGLEVARIFALNGYDLFLCSRSEAGLLDAAEKLRTEFPSISVEARAADLSDKRQAISIGEWIAHTADGIDVLVNNAGTFVQGDVSGESDGALEKMLDVNLYSAYHLTRSLVPSMKQRKAGHIFTVCSIASLAAYPGGGAYGISKYALLGFTKNLRLELREHGIKVTAIIPGAVYTDSWKGSGVSEDRIMQASDIAKMIFATTQLSPQAVVEEIVIRPQLGDL